MFTACIILVRHWHTLLSKWVILRTLAAGVSASGFLAWMSDNGVFMRRCCSLIPCAVRNFIYDNLNRNAKELTLVALMRQTLKYGGFPTGNNTSNTHYHLELPR